MKEVPVGSQIKFWTDNKGVRDVYVAGAAHAVKSSNCDLFHELFNIRSNKCIQLEVEWMPSHLKDEGCKKHRPEYVTDLDIEGNSYADKYAGEAAELVQVPLQVATECIYYYQLVKKLQWRFISIISSLPARVKNKAACNPKSERVALQQKIDESIHIVSRRGDRYTCSSCRDSFTIKDPAFQHWLAGVCIPAPCDDRPEAIQASVHLGNLNAHFTHRLCSFQGMVYCGRCGSRGKQHMRRLARPCVPPGAHGKLTLKCIMSGRLPLGSHHSLPAGSPAVH